MLYMYDAPVVWSKMILYAMWYDAMALAYSAQTKIAIVYMREQTCDTRDNMIPIWYGMYAMYGVDH